MSLIAKLFDVNLFEIIALNNKTNSTMTIDDLKNSMEQIQADKHHTHNNTNKQFSYNSKEEVISTILFNGYRSLERRLKILNTISYLETIIDRETE